jgi:hypothetical protein
MRHQSLLLLLSHCFSLFHQKVKNSFSLRFIKEIELAHGNMPQLRVSTLATQGMHRYNTLAKPNAAVHAKSIKKAAPKDGFARQGHEAPGHQNAWLYSAVNLALRGEV